MSDAAPPRVASFDRLRGLAVLLIGLQLCAEVLVFGFADTNVASWPRVLVYDFSLTNAGIPVFFLISGYFIPASFRGPRPTGDFIVRRILRLYPVFLAAALLALALLPFESGVTVGLGGMVRSLVLMDPPAPVTPFAHIHWLLMALLVFYALCIAAALAGCVRSRLYPVIAMMVLLAMLAGMIVVGHLYHRHFPIAVLLALVLAHLGTFTANTRRGSDPERRRRDVVLLVLFAAAVLLVSYFAWSTAWGAGELWLGKALGYAVAMALVVACAFDRLPMPRLLAAVGALSYPLFFFLPLLISVAAPHLMRIAPAQRLLPLAGVAAAAVVLAVLAHLFIERPVERRRRNLLAAP